MLKYVCVLVLFVALAPVFTTCSTDRASSALRTEDEVAIYAAVIYQLATVDDTFGGNLKPPRLYVIRNTDDRAGSPHEQQSNSKSISLKNQDSITGALNHLSADIIWVDGFKNAEFEDGTGRVKGGGAIITLGNIYPQADGSVKTAGSIYIANLAAGGTTYILKKAERLWKVTGSTGTRWIS